MTLENSISDNIFLRYLRAQHLMQSDGNCSLVANATIFPVWLEDSSCFWYERAIHIEKNCTGPDASLMPWDKEYRLVNAVATTNTLAFDHESLAQALADRVSEAVNPDQLPIDAVEMKLADAQTVGHLEFTAFGKRWGYHVPVSELNELPSLRNFQKQLFSSDGSAYLFVRDYNLWVNDIASGEEKALTADGEEHHCYAVVGNGWGIDMGAGIQARWSADGKKVITVQRDSRQVLTVPIVEHVPQDGSLRPKLHNLKLAVQGDEHIPEYRLLAIDLESGRRQAAHYPGIPVARNSFGFFDSKLGWWSNDNRHAYFVDVARGYQQVSVVEWDTLTGNTRVLFQDTSDTRINLMVNDDEYPTIEPLPESDELIWFSERSGWAHLYLYDLKTGALKNAITSGNFVVRNILAVDHQQRELILHTMGRTPGRDPYYRDIVRVNIDTGEMVTLVSSDDDYFAASSHHFDMETMTLASSRDIQNASACSRSGQFMVATRSRADRIPETVLFDRQGQEILLIERADISALHSRVSEHWQWPEPVSVKAADGTADLYGLIWRPSNFSAEKNYPVINFGFNTPELPRVPKGSFSNSSSGGYYYHWGAALAELGFIVVQIDGRGTPFRSKAFQDTSYGWAESAGSIDDQVAGIRQLAERYSYMDLERVGICSLGGGTGAVQGLLHYPEFFKVGVHGMLHDSRLMAAPMWSDKYEGLTGPDPEQNYVETYADNLQGKLLLFNGMMDFCTLPANTFRLIEALQKSNKDFDLIMLPNLGHGYSDYLIRRAWDYFVTHLKGEEPPREFRLSSA